MKPSISTPYRYRGLTRIKKRGRLKLIAPSFLYGLILYNDTESAVVEFLPRQEATAGV